MSQPEYIIISTNYRRFWEIATLDRMTDKRAYYTPLPDRFNRRPRSTFCDLHRVVVRNASVDLFKTLQAMEEVYGRERKAALEALHGVYKEQCRAAVEKAGATVQGTGGIS